MCKTYVKLIYLKDCGSIASWINTVSTATISIKTKLKKTLQVPKNLAQLKKISIVHKLLYDRTVWKVIKLIQKFS